MGHVLWDYEVANPDNNDSFHAVTGDNLGNLYMAGVAGVFKSNVDGDIEWMRDLNVGYVDDVAADALGSIFVAGYTLLSLGGPNAGGYDAFLRKYNDAGDHLWTRQFRGATSDFGYGVATDGMGNVFVAGVRELPTAVDAFVRKYDSNGNLLWNRQIGGAGVNAEVFAIASDDYGNIYAAGRTTGSLGAANAGGFDAFVRKYDSAGNTLWTHQLGSSGGDETSSITLDGHGNVILSGITRGNLGGPLESTYDAWVALLREYLPGDYNHNGNVDAADYVLWRKTDGTPAGYNTWRVNFGQPSGSGSVAGANAAVPEPTTLVMLTVAAVSIRLRRRHIA